MVTSLVERLRTAIPEARDQMCGLEFVDIALAADTIEAMQAALKTARTYMTDFEGLPHWDHDNPLRQIDAALAMVESEIAPQPEPIEDATYEPADGGQI